MMEIVKASQNALQRLGVNPTITETSSPEECVIEVMKAVLKTHPGLRQLECETEAKALILEAMYDMAPIDFGLIREEET